MPVTWRDELSVGNELIDHDHKYLICVFNSIELALTNGDTVKHLPMFFDQLADYTREHFTREEAIQLKIKYPEYVEHKIAHQQILESLDEVRSELRRLFPEGGEGGATVDDALLERLNREVLTLAREWIIDHIIKTDRKMTNYLRKLPPDFR